MIEIRNLCKQYGRLRVLDNLNLTLQGGRITAIAGPNGAGKTTLIKCILGVVWPDSGEIVINGKSIERDWTYREHIGYMPQVAHFPEHMTGRRLLQLLRELRGEDHPVDEELLHVFQMDTELDKPVRALSGGNRQKVSALLAFLFNPDILFLDEPTVGLDPIASSLLKEKIMRTREERRMVVLTSHIMSEIEELADDLVFLVEGRVWYHGGIQALKEQTGEERLEKAVAKIMAKEAYGIVG